jgi:VWFA-related protein
MRRLLFCVFLSSVLLAQAPEDSGVTLRSNSHEVLLDMVVRDKHEKLVRDLKPEDVEVYENGVRQQIKSFRLISGKDQLVYEQQQASGKGPSGRPIEQSVRNFNIVAIVFHSMSPKGRDFAREAALEFLNNDLLPNTYVAVFSLDTTFNALQAFTNDKAALIRAVNHAVSGNYSDFAKTSNDILNHVDYQISTGQSGPTVTSAIDPAQQPGLSTAGVDASLDQASKLLSGILHGNMLVTNYQVGMRSIAALLNLTREMGKLPGRKTVLYMSEGLVLPADNMSLFHRAMSEANRTNVTFYTLDARGLTTTSSSQAGMAELASVANSSRHQSDNDPQRGQFQDDYLQYSVRAANTQQSMRELAESTGGFSIENTNSVKKPIAHIMEDIRAHYELTFTPTSTTYDGKYRKLEVRLARTGLRTQSRDGYYALPNLNGDSLQAFETANLSALSGKSLPHQFPYRATALRFRPGSETRQCAVTFEVPIANLKAVSDPEKKATEVHASFLALVKDPTGQVVAKISKDLPYSVDSDRFEQFKAGNMIFTQAFDLPNGRYTLETSVVDFNSGQSSARKTVLLVGSTPGVDLSSVTLVRRLDPLKGARDAADPLEFDGGQVTPTLLEESKAGSAMMLYFVVYPNAGTPAEKPKLTMQFFADGKEVSRQMPSLPEPDKTGAIPFLAEAKLNPGQYEVRVTVQQGTATARESSGFVVQ